MKPARETIKQTLQYANAGEFERALVLLDGAIRDAIIESAPVAILARHAAVIAEQAGDLSAVRRYYEVAVEHDPGPWMYLALGDVCRRLGDETTARQNYSTGLMMAGNSGDADVIALLKERTQGGRTV
jgi:Tfp pilus assembly protein PilF